MKCQLNLLSHFLQIYYAGVSKNSGLNEFIATINATDRDAGLNATVDLLITASNLYKFGATRSTGSLANSPFGKFNTFSHDSHVSRCLMHFLSSFSSFTLCSPSRSAHIAISQDGRLTTNSLMAEYNQDRFELEINAKEVQSPERSAKAKVLVSENLLPQLFDIHSTHLTIIVRCDMLKIQFILFKRDMM